MLAASLLRSRWRSPNHNLDNVMLQCEAVFLMMLKHHAIAFCLRSLLAQSGHATRHEECPLSRIKQTLQKESITVMLFSEK